MTSVDRMQRGCETWLSNTCYSNTGCGFNLSMGTPPKIKSLAKHTDFTCVSKTDRHREEACLQRERETHKGRLFHFKSGAMQLILEITFGSCGAAVKEWWQGLLSSTPHRLYLPHSFGSRAQLAVSSNRSGLWLQNKWVQRCKTSREEIGYIWKHKFPLSYRTVNRLIFWLHLQLMNH